MITIVGLGNPGSEYCDTRHNVGWMMLSTFVEKQGLPSFIQSSRYAGLLSEGLFEGVQVGVLLPTTFMNHSGTSVAKYLKETKTLETLIVVHDDIDLPLGDVRVSYDRGSGGHNGVQSIIDTLTTKRFARVRVGIAQKNFFGAVKRPKGDALSNFVLGEFTKAESALLPLVGTKVEDALRLIIACGVTHAMQEVNG